MEYLYRALNEYDLIYKPLENGLFNKETIDNCSQYIFKLIISQNSVIHELLAQHKITETEWNQIYIDFKEKCIPKNLSFILFEIENTNKIIKNLYNNLYTKEGWMYVETKERIKQITSTIQTHLMNGSKKETSWISCSKDLYAIQRYYLNQKKHAVALIKSQINDFFDTSENQIELALDLSNWDKIIENHSILVNKKTTDWLPYKETNLNCRGFAYANNSKEVIYYNHIPQEKIITLLHPLEIDLLWNNALNLPMYEKDNKTKLYYEKMLFDLRRNLEKDNILRDEIAHIYFEHYKNNNPLRSIVTTNYEYLKLVKTKKKMLSYINANNILIRKPLVNNRMLIEE